MIIEFSCSNFKSIKEKMTLSFVAGKDKTNEDELINFGELKLLRTAVIYGANGSGKSNFLNALSFMRLLITNSINHQPGQGIFMSLHKLSSKDELSSFSMQFIKQNTRYAYGFSLRYNEVYSEYLYKFPNERQMKIFEREGMEISEGSKYKGRFGSSYDILKENRLFLSCIANYSKLEDVEDVFRFYNEDIVLYEPNVNNWHMYTANQLINNADNKKIFVEMLQEFGVKVTDVKANIRELNINDFPQPVADHMKSLIPSEKFNQPEFKLVYDKFETDLMSEESDGIKKLFEVIFPIIDIIQRGKLLIFDEMESSFHELIVCELIKLFKEYSNSKFAQLLFSTHDTGLLDAKLFRRDEIWFTEQNDERATDLYSLAEIKNVRKHENFINGYMTGKYGAIPFLSSNIATLLKGNKGEGDDNN